MSTELWTSVELLNRYRAGEEAAAAQLFERYMQRLTALARARLSARLASRADPEDVAMSAWRSFFIGARNGRFVLNQSGDLWRLLVQITLHKLYHQARRHAAGSRSVNREQPLESVDPWLASTDGRPTVEDVVAIADELEHLLAGLDSVGRRIMELRLQGEELTAIAADTGRSERTVRRVLADVRRRMALRLGRDHPQEDESLVHRQPDHITKRVVQPLRRDARAPLEYSDFQLQRLIGAGRVGKVYRAWQKSVSRLVAVKHLRKSFLDQADVVERFVGEGQMLAQLNHAGIVSVYGLGQTPSGGYFIAMQWVDGPDLARLPPSQPPTVEHVVRWIMQASDAIDYAHRQGVVHCDLKPANLLLGPDGRIRVTDFGLARFPATEMHIEERIEGTAPFMAPEQVSSVWGRVGPQTDVFGLGAVLYTLLTGRPPHDGTRTADVLARVVAAAPVIDPREIRPDLPPAIVDICLRCVAKQPTARYRTVDELRAALAGASDQCDTA